MDQTEKKQIYFTQEVEPILLWIIPLRCRIAFCILFLFALGYGQAPADFRFYKTITIQSSEIAGSSELTDFPFLFSVSNPDFRTTTFDGKLSSNDGYDILFTNSDGTVTLDHQLESYNALNGTIDAWVKTNLDPTINNELRIYFGSSTVNTSQSTSNTWDTGYKAVWHLNSDNMDGTATDADLINIGTDNAPYAIISDAQNFDAGTHLQTAPNNDLNINLDITLEGWVFLDDDFSAQYANTIISGAGNETGANFPFYLNINEDSGDHRLGLYWEYGSGYPSFEYIKSVKLPFEPVGAWNHYAVTKNASTDEIKFYVNGVLISTASYPNSSEATASATNHSVRLGRSHEDTADARMDGKLDEVRISNIVRSPEWLLTSFNTMTTAAFFSLGASMPNSCDASFSYAKTLYCETETHPQATITGDNGGTFSSPDGNITFNNINNGDVNLLTSSKGGPFDIVYTSPAGCTRTEQVTILAKPSDAVVGLNRSVCGSTVDLNAAPPTVGSGIWTIASGGTGSFDNPASPSAQFTADDNATTYSLTWTVSNATCFDAFIDVDITFEPNPTTADAGISAVECSVLNHNLDGNIPTTGNGIWTIDPSDIAKGGSFDNASLPNAVFTGVPGEAFTLHWTITNGSCESTDSKTVAFRNFEIADAGLDQNICELSTALAGNINPSYTFDWNVLSGGGTVDNPTSSTTNVNGLTPGTNIIEYTITQGLCSDSDQVRILVDSVAPVFTNTVLDTTFYYESVGCNTSYAEVDLEALFTFNDGCDSSPSISYTYANWVAGCGNDQSRNVTVDLEDAAGNTTTHSFIVTERDTTAPTFIAPRDTIINTCNSDLTTAALGVPTGLFDNCSSPSYSHTETNSIPACVGEQVITRTWTVEDDCGNIATSTQIITLVDNTAPSFTKPRDTIIYRKIDCTIDTFPIAGGLLDVLDEVDDCSTGLEATYTNLIVDNCGGGFTMTRRWRLEDDCNNVFALDQSITVLDTFPPTFTEPSDITVHMDLTCDADTAAVASQAGDVVDESDGCSTGLNATYTNSIDVTGACGSGYVITRTWTLQDNCGNSTTKDQIITVLDTIAPMFTVPVTANIYLDLDCNYNADSSITGTPTDIVDNCPTTIGNPTISDVLTPGSCEGEFTITRTWSMEDVCGNSRSYNQIINVIDTIRPTFTTPRDTNLYFNNDCDPIVTTIANLGDVIDEDDNCTSSLDATFNDVSTILCGDSYQIARTWSLTDNCGNTTTSVQVINVLDTIKPTYTIAVDITLYQDGNCRADMSFVGTGGVSNEMDNCSSGLNAVYRDSVVTPTCIGSYVVYRLWELSDDCNNVNKQTQVITVLDEVAPTFFTPQNDTIYVDNTCFADTTLTGLGNIISVLENCSSLDTAYTDVVTQLCEGSYRLFRTWTLTDDCGNSTSRDQFIVVLDTISPSFTAPNDTTIHLSVGCNPNLTPALTGDVTDESDNCTTSLNATYSDSAIPGCGLSEEIVRTWTLTDDCGNSVFAEQTISVVDTTAPTFTVPVDVTVYKSNNCTEIITVDLTGDVTTESDFCPGVNQATFSDTRTDGSCSGEIILQRTWTVTDACGNSSSRDQIITIADTTSPYFILPLNRTIYVDASCVADTAIGSTGTITSAGDNCDLSPTLSFSQVITNNNCIGNYDIERTWNLEDNCGNVKTGTQVIEVRDNIAPALTIPADQTVYLGGGTSCTDLTSINFESGYQTWIKGGPNADIEQQFPNSGNSSVRLQNGSTSSLIISPRLNLSSYTQAFIDFSYYVAHMNDGEVFQVQISNNDGGSYSVLQNYVAGIDFNDGNRYNPSVTIPTSLHSPNIRIRFRLFGDSNADQIFIDDIVINGCVFDSSCTIDTSPGTQGIANAANDNCSGAHIPTFTDIVEAACGSTFITRRVWTVEDDCGNISSATQTIEVLDTVSPEMIVPEDLVIYLDNTCSTIDTTTTGIGIATILGDNCDPNPTLSYSDSFSNQCGQQLTINRLWTIVDICGNERSASQIIEILDTVSPVLNGIPADAHYQCSTPDAAPELYVDITASDVCDSSVVITFNQTSTRTFDNSCSDVIYTITRTWTATDACGNATSQTQNITASCECCNNGIDDDGDGAIDETDSDCPCTTSIVSLNCSPSYYYFIPSIWRLTGGNYDDPSRLIITTPSGTANYTIRTADNSYMDTRVVNSGTADEIILNTSNILTTGFNQVEDNKGFIIEADQALQVLYQLDAHFNKLLITYKGEQALGQRFRTASQTNICGNNPSRDDENHFISVMAAEDNTEVTFEFDFPLDGITSPHTVTLDAGETYLVKDRVRANQTVTGALVTADRPIAVVSGSQHTMNCNNSGGNAPGRDGGADQLVPTCLIGEDYVAVRGSGQDYSNYVIVVGVSASTGIYLNGNATPVATVGPGEYYEYQLSGNFGDAHYIRTDRPAYAYQVGNLSTNNEPGMAIMSPVGDCRGESAIEFVAFTGSENGVNVLVPNAGMTTLELNDVLFSNYSGITTASVPGLPTYTSVTIPNEHINTYNRLESNEPFIASQYVGVSGQSGTYGYLTSFKDEVVITNPSTGTADFQYSLDTLCGGLVFNHCVDATSCSGGQYITDVIPGPHTTDVFFDPTGFNTCFSYVGEAGYDGFDEITVYVADAYGLITAICVDIYLCGSSPFIKTIPGDTLILCSEVIPAPPVFSPINAGCSQSYDLVYDADSTITYTELCSDYAFTITRSWRLTDNCGNDTTVYQIITIADTVNPTLIVPPDTLIFADGICGLDTLISSTGEAEDIADNCDPNLYAVYTDSFEVNPTCTGSFLIYRLWSITDDCGNIYENEQLIEIRDTIKPTFTPPRDTTIYTDDMCLADTSSVHTGMPIGMADNCDVGLVSSYSDVSTPGCDGSFVLTRTWRVSDDCGNFSLETQTIAVFDTIGPTIIVPSDTTLYRATNCLIDTTATNIGLANTSTDNCDTNISVIHRDSVITGCDQSFVAYRIWSATDNCGNQTSQIQTITVADTSRPTMTIPRDTIIYKSDLCFIDTTTVALGDATDEGDNCSLISSLQATYDDVVTDNCNQGYTIARHWTLVDGCGNTAVEIQSITVADSTAPEYLMPRDTILYANLSCNANTDSGMTGIPSSITDNCDSAPSTNYRDEVMTYCVGQYDIFRIWEIADDCGNVAIDTQLISVLDTIPPEYITPSNVTLYSDVNCFTDTSVANTGFARFENDNCDLTLNPTYYDSLGMGCGIGYEIFRKWSVEDDCGNNFQSTQVITILDRIDPTFTIPSDTTLYVNALCVADTTIISTGDVLDEKDNCDPMVNAIYTDNVMINCLGGYTITRTWTVQDDCGNGVSQDQTIVVRDTTAPLFTAPRDTVLYSSSACVIDTMFTQIGDVIDEADACDSTLQANYQDQIIAPCQGSLNILRIWTLADDCGNVTVDTQAITVLDTIRPLFSIPRDTVLYADIDCNTDVSISSTGGVDDESDNCDTSLDATFTDNRVDGCEGLYTITRTWSLTDDCGNNLSGNQIIEVQDTTAPTFTTPADITIYFDVNCLVNNTPIITGDITDESDGCDSSVDATYTDNMVPGCGNNYVLTRTWTSSDDCGNTYSSDQTISVIDTLDPTFLLPNNTTLYLDSGCTVDTSVAALGRPTSVVDNCGGVVQVSYNNTIVTSCEGSYEILREWSFTDVCNNTVSDTQRIIVIDTLAPIFTAPLDMVLYKDIDCLTDTTALTNGSPTVISDNCASSIDVTYIDITSSLCEGALSITRRWTLVDDCGNNVSYDQMIEVRDTLDPEFTIPRDTTIYLASGCIVDVASGLLGDVTNESDNCDTSLDASYTDITSAICGASYDIERTWSLTDDCGNIQTGIQTIQIRDTLDPIVTLPADAVLYKDDLCAIDTTSATLGSATATDNCAGTITINYNDIVTSSCEGSMDILRVWTIADACMNMVIDTQYISVSDTSRPEFSTPIDIEIYVDDMCKIDTTVTNTGNITDERDNCDTSLDAVYTDVVNSSCTGSYIIERTWSLTDDCGNIHQGIQQITVRDTISPDFSVPSDTTLYVDNMCQADSTLALIGDVIDESDNCSSGIQATYSDVVVSGCSGSYTMNRTWTLQDDCGNLTSKIQIINLVDTLRPSLSAPRDTVAHMDLTCSVDTMPSSTGILTSYSDNCDSAPIISYSDAISTDCGNTFTITRTWSVLDECGNTQSDDQIIQVLDTLKPSFSAPIDISIYKDASCNHSADVLVTGDVIDEADNCDTTLDATFSDSSIAGCDGHIIITRTWVLEDDCGNITRDTQLITVLDTIRPTFTIPADITLTVDNVCAVDTSVITTGDIIDEADNCDNTLDATYSDAVTDGCSGSFTIARTWTLSDDCGNTTSSVQTITVSDNSGPSFTVPGDTTIYMTAACIADTTVIGTGDVIDEMDSCDSTLNAVYTDVIDIACQNSFTITRNWSLTDDCNNVTLGIQTIIVLDTIRPTFSAPTDTVLYKDASCLFDADPIFAGDVIDEDDNCDTSLNATYIDAVSSSCEGETIITRTWTLIDDCDNIYSDNQIITILDTLRPAFTTPADITIYKDLSCDTDDTVLMTGDVTDESDNCSTNIQATYVDDISDNCIGSQTIRRTWTLIDNCGNQYATEQNIIVLDTFAPSFIRPADVTLYAEIACAMDTSSVSTGEPTAMDDNCSLAMVATYADDVVEVCPGTFTIARTWSVADVCGNSSTQVQSITVLDTLSPIFSPPADATVYASINCITDTSTVNTGLILRDSVQECQPDVIIDYTDNIVTICGGSYTLERTWEVSDFCGNTRSGIQTITVLDTTAPVFTTPIDTLLYVDDMCYADTTISSTGSVSSIIDGCDNLTEVEYIDRITGVCAGSYIIERTWLVSDQCDNTAASIQIINVQATLAPTFTPPSNLNVFLDSLNLVDTSLAIVGNVSDISDNCSNDLEITYRDSIVEIMSNQVAFESFRFWTIKDQCGNARTLQQQIGFIDTIPPSFTTPPIIEVDCEFIPLPDTLDFSDINNVVDIRLTETIIDTPCIDRYTLVRTWTATDGVGNQTSVDRIIQVTTCNITLDAAISDSTPCVGEFVSLNSSLSHPTHPNEHYPRWFYRQLDTDPWTAVTGGDQSNLTFPAYEFRSGEYKVIYASQADHLDPQTCQYHSDIMSLNVSGEQQISHRSAIICEGETYAIGNSTFFVEGDYNIVYPNANSCDSIVTLHLTVLNTIAQTTDVSICQGEYIELTNGTRYDESGIYYDSLSNVQNCDSIIVINLTVDRILRDTLIEQICIGKAFSFNGRSLTTEGVYSDTLQSVTSCDSIVVLDLSIVEEISRTEDVTICTGGSYPFDGYLLYRDTIWQKSFTSVSGCDSLVTLDLKVVDEMVTTLFDTTCYQQPVDFGGLTLIQSGIYRDTLMSQYGCDSIIVLDLLMRDEINTSFNIQLCAGESYPYKNQTYTGSFTDVITSATSCDSIITFNIQIGNTDTVTDDIPLCAGDSILIGDDYIKSSGTYTDILSNVRGCLDSTVVYNVTMKDVIALDREVVLCSGDSILIGGIYRRATDTYVDVHQSQITGCDSTTTTNLIVEDVIELYADDVNICQGETFTIVVDGVDNLSWSSSDLLSCDNCPNPSGKIDKTTIFTATAEGCANQQLAIDVTVNVFNEVQIEVLTPDTVLTYGESILLEAFVTDPFTQITWYDQFGNVICTNCSSTEVTPVASTFYYAEANGDSGCTVSDTITTDIRDACAEGEIIVPNFISPNGDGLNDDLRVRYNAIRSISKLRIFNRWGQLIFKTDDIDNDRWDGSINGTQGNPGVYVYFLEYQCLNGDEVFKKGSVTILR